MELRNVKFTVQVATGEKYVCEVRNLLANDETELGYLALGIVESFFYSVYAKILNWQYVEQPTDVEFLDYYYDYLNKDIIGWTDGKGYMSSYRNRRKYVRN